jgi:ferredoxin-thioredoxin reductase catalytic chain
MDARAEAKERILEATKEDAKANGYGTCPDAELLEDLLDGLAQNEERFGYRSCPCRLASGVKTYDADLICPCEYRDADVNEHGMCYCGLYVTKEVHSDPGKMGPIPERRPPEAFEAGIKAGARRERGLGPEAPLVEAIAKVVPMAAVAGTTAPAIPVWRCKVCGYLCARETPPGVCPICKAKADKFERFPLG